MVRAQLYRKIIDMVPSRQPDALTPHLYYKLIAANKGFLDTHLSRQPPVMNHNHLNYQVRLDFVHGLLREKFDLPENTKVEPIAYDPECPFKYNNFVYRISLPSPLDKENGVCQSQPGCVAIPSGNSELILRLTNSDAAGMGAADRVENEVAMITLAAAALGPIFKPHVVPRLYDWVGSTSKQGKRQQGWILQELMPGTPLDEKLDDMGLEEKKKIFAQIAKLLKGLQDFPLPASITQFGGLTFDNESNIISAPMTSTGKPTRTPTSRAGTRTDGVRARLEAFVERGLPASFEPLESRDQKVIVHADFTPNNLLFDASSGYITGLIDYDFSCILHPSYEFLRSFDGVGSQFRGWSGIEGREQKALKEAKLHGFPDPLPDDKDGDNGVQWKVAKAWEDELEKAGCKRPMTIPGIDKVADVDALLGSILPWRVTNSDILRRQTDEVIRNCRDENEGVLIQILEHNGF
ncbi:hypothetical protein PENDEC_c005G06412 [Penicillium decumbens]|uniref:Aminoglycoside phosphotransferase domain-containing protein n=1 Tax=Penicillium decumbens TaxID=69771 RepID=A0A1V6PG00_PENDC|nr:hypothetical protein PENDEC_c005G06412 [Penicillium decumbens]